MTHFHLRNLLTFFCVAITSLAIAGGTNQLNNVFVENRGQVKDEKGAAANNVLFYKTGPLQLFVTTTGYSAIVKKHNKKSVTYNKIDFVFDNARIRKDQVVYVKDRTAALNIYHGGEVLTGINGCKTVLIKNIYPGIDWLWTIDTSGNANHDFMVNYEADASVIHYHVEGAGVANSGNIIKYSNPKFRLKEGPVVFQTRKQDLPGKLIVKGNAVSFEISDSLKKGGFTIDPPIQLDWSASDDTGTYTGFRSICADDSFNTFTAGYSNDFTLPVFPQVNGSYSTEWPANTDVVLMKTDWNQNLVWATFFGGSNNDEANAIISTPSGIFVAGYSESWDFPVEPAVNGNYDRVVALNGRDAFIAKFNSTGILRWSTGYGGSGTDEAMDIKYYNGKIYIVGYTGSRDFPMDSLPGAYNFSSDSVTKTDAFLLEFDTAGNRLWATAFGGSGNDYMTSVFADASGIYTTGYCDSVDTAIIPMQSFGNAYYQDTFHNMESFITRFSNAGALQWSTYFGGLGNDAATCILRNNCGLYICGKTTNNGLPVLNPGSGAYYQPGYGGGNSDGFIAEFDPDSLNETYCTYFGDTGTEVLTKMASDTFCHVIFTGFSNAPLPYNNIQYFFDDVYPAGGFDGLMLGIDQNNNIFWSTLFGTKGDDFAYGLQFPKGFPDIYVVDMVGEGFYDFGKDTIGGTFYSDAGPCPFVTTNGESNRFFNCRADTLAGGAPGGPGGSLLGGCGGVLEFQSLIPLRTACPQECNGWAIMDTANEGGCPPYTFLWSSGGQQVMDTNLCTNYWGRVIDPSLDQARTIYSKYDVLRVAPLPIVYTNCLNVPNWDSLIHPAGGEPPYTIDFRGVGITTCPTTAYFAVTDSVGCVVSFSTTWFQDNINLTPFLDIAPDCKLQANFNADPGNCPNFDGSASWQWVITGNHTTDTFGFNENQIPQNLNTPTASGYYAATLNLGDCIVNVTGVFFYQKPDFKLEKTPDCANNDGALSVVIYPDTAALHHFGADTVKLVLQDSTTDSLLVDSMPVIFTSADSQVFTFNNLPGHTYHVSLFNNSCDSTTKSADLAVVQFSFNNPFVVCGDSTQLIATVQHGLPPFTFQWSSNSISPDSDYIWIDSPSIYTLTVTDHANCSASAADTVPGTLAVKIDSIVAQNIECPYSDGGYIAAAAYVTGGAQPYSFNWSSGEQSSTAVLLLPSVNNTLTVTDLNNCTASGTFYDSIPPPMQVTDSSFAPLCFYDSYGNMIVYITGGFSGPTGLGYTVLWLGNSGTFYSGNGYFSPPYVAASPGLMLPDYYSYTVTDYYGCTATGSDSVKFAQQITFNQDTINCLCYGDNSGGAELTNIQSTISYTVYWSNNVFGAVDSGIPSGFYTAYLTDSNGCQYNANFYVSQPTQLMAVVDSGLGIPCNGQSAIVIVTGTGGTPPYSDTGTYQLGAGSYHFFLVDSNGCQVDYSFSLSEPPVFTDNVSVTQPSCSNGYEAQVIVNANGGVPPYFIYTPDSIYQSNFYFNPGSLNGVSPGEDSVITTDSHGCALGSAIAIDSNYPATGYITPANLLCANGNNGSVTITMTSGESPFNYEGNYFYNTYQINNLDTGAYVFIVYDSLGCPDSFSTTLTSPPPFQAYDTLLQPILCYGDSAQVLITATGGLPLYNGIGVYTLSPNSYQEYVYDGNGCQASVSFTVTSPDSISASYGLVQAGCSGQTALVNIYATGGTGFITGTGEYSADSGQVFYVTDANGCTDSVMTNFTVPPPLSDTFRVASLPACAFGNAYVTVYVSGGAGPYFVTTLSLPGFEDSITLTVLPGTSYSYEVEDSLGCLVPVSFTVPQATGVFIMSDSVIRYPECNVDSGEVLISVEGGEAPYQLLTPGGNLYFHDSIYLALTAGAYSYTVYDSFGCNTSLAFDLNPSNLFTVSSTHVNPACYADTTGLITLNIYNGSQPYIIDSFTQGGTYVPFLTPPDMDSLVQLNNLPAGAYNFEITDSVGCSAFVDTLLTSPPRLFIDSSLLHSGITCTYASNATIAVTAGGGTPGYTYTLLPLPGGTPITQGDSAFTGLATGAYEVIVTDANQCTDTAQAAVPVFIPSADSLIVDSATCYGTSTGAIKVYATPAYRSPYTYSLNGGAPQVFNVFYNLTAGAYQIVVTDTNGCKDTLSAFIGQPDSIDPRVWLNGTLLPLDTLYLTDQQFANFTKQNFDPWRVTITPALPDSFYSDTLVRVQTSQTVSYTVKVYMDSSDLGCYIEYQGVIIVLQVADIPNTITPNGDGFNDVWKIDLLKYPNAAITIFDRWGEVVYTTSNYDNSWGGIDQKNGRQLPDGTYFYIMKVPSQGDMVLKGDINILDSKR